MTSNDLLLLSSFNTELIFAKLTEFGFRLMISILIFAVGLFIISWISRFVKKALRKSPMEPTAATFLESLVTIALKGLLMITIVLQLGVEKSSILALLGTMGLAIGLALQGSLSNFAGGVLILILKPFKVGDLIEIQNFLGKVEKIQVFHSFLVTPDNKAITIPNSTMVNSIVTNFSAKPTRRVDVVFQVSYDSDIEKVKEILQDMITNHPKVLKDPAPFLRMTAQADSSLTFTSRSWANAEDYWEVYFDFMEQSKIRFDRAGIEIPYNKLDINVVEKKLAELNAKEL